MDDTISIDDYYNLKFLKSAVIDEAASKIAYTVATYEETSDEDEFDFEECIHVWLRKLDKGITRQLT